MLIIPTSLLFCLCLFVFFYLFIFYFIIRHIYKILCAGAAFLGITLGFESDTVYIDRQTKLTDEDSVFKCKLQARWRLNELSQEVISLLD